MISKSHLKQNILNQSLSVAISSPSKIKMGAILFRKKKLIAASCNYDQKTHPVQSFWANRTAKVHGEDFAKKPFIHCEIGCLIKAKENADTIIVCRVGGHSGRELRYARPCPICEMYLRYSNIQHIHYSTRQGFLYEFWS